MSESSKLVNIYFNALVQRLPNVKFEIEDANTIIAINQEYTVRISLDNLRRDFKDNEDDVDNLIEKYVNSLAETFQPKSQVDLTRIVPVIKPADYLKEIQAQAGFDNADYLQNCVYDLYNDELIIVYAEDTNASIKYLFKKDLEHINFEEGALKALAIQNIDRMLNSIQKKGCEGVYMVIAGGDYEASMILIDSIITKENFDVNGDIVIAIPNRDMLLITGSKDLAGLNKIKEAAVKTFTTGAHNLSPYLFKWNGNKFEKFNSLIS